MRLAAVSFLIAGCMVEPAAPPPLRYGPPPAAPRPREVEVAPDAFAQLEASATIDGWVVADVAPGGAATVVVVFASWCSHCRDELAAIDQIRLAHPGMRAVGVNYRGHEEYDQLGDAAKVRAYVGAHAPWLIVVPAGDDLFTALGRPPKIPTIYVYDRDGALVEVYDRRTRAMPTAGDLDRVLTRIGA